MKIVLFLVLISIAYSVTTITPKNTCSCSQLLNENECQAQLCFWSDSKCQQVPTTAKQYCDSFTQIVCSTTIGCAYYNSACQIFTGCSAYVQQTEEACKAISQNCTSDGIKCIPLGACSNYTTNISCVKDSKSNYCYWNSETSICQNIEECAQLPITLISDSDCRAQLSTCTVKSTGGCVTSGEECKDQTEEGMCVTNLKQTTVCFWDSTAGCQDKICDNAPKSNITNQQCIDFLPTCTVKSDSLGCVVRANTCGELTTQGQCITNAIGAICYWNNNKCEDKNCGNAPQEYISDEQCKGYISTCTLNTTGKGCMVRLNKCTDLQIQGQCIKDAQGNNCFWNGTQCLEKTCINALDTNKTNAMCSTYLDSCTIQLDLTGCMDRLATCAEYTIQEQCVKRKDGGLCVFLDNKCIDRICANAPLTYVNETSCQSFSLDCTLNQLTKKGCVQNVCSSQLTENSCKFDYQKNACIFAQICQIRTCDNAPITNTSDALCRTFLSSCTVKSTGIGCITRALSCDAIESHNQCVATTGNTQLCSWDNTQLKCRNINCLDAPVTYNTNKACLNYYDQCTVSATLSGCVPRMNSCADLPELQCNEVKLLPTGYCSWYKSATIPICRERNCEDAPDSFTTDSVCRSYLPTCIAKSSGSGCQAEPTVCSGYQTQAQCDTVIATSIKCGWNGCEARSCSNITKVTNNSYTHADCNSYMSGCTVSSDQNSCVSQMQSCNGLENIHCGKVVLLNGTTCFWAINDSTPSCRASKCTDVLQTNKTHAECQAFLNTCTVGPTSAGCVDQMSSCQDLEQIQCTGVVLLGGGFCSWGADGTDTQKCRSRDCADALKTDYLTHKDCQQFLNTCTLAAIDGGCVTQTNTCTGIIQSSCNYVTLINGKQCSWGVLLGQCRDRTCSDASNNLINDSECRGFMSTCTVNVTEFSCVDEGTNCSSFQKSQCFKHSVMGQCFWNSSGNPPSCRAAVCTDAPKTYITSSECSNYIRTCTVSKDGGCTSKMQICTGLTQEQCPKVTLTTDKQCSWSGTACRDRQCGDAEITIKSENECRQWMVTCTLQIDGTGCTDEANSCDLVQSFDQCKQLSNGQKCGWNIGCVGRVCSNAPITYSTDVECRGYLSICTVQEDGTGCVLRNSTCATLNSQLQCVALNDYSKYCQWNLTKCEDRSCSNAPQTYTTDSQCRNHLTNCTVDSKGTGCTTRNNTCNNLITEGQCVTTFSGSKCQWIKDSLKCVDMVSQCSSYVLQSTCTQTVSGQKCTWINQLCFDRTCENAPKSYSTNDQCNQYQSGCTTSGKGCIDKRLCSQYISNACFQGTDGLCTLVSQCSTKSCIYAPNTYKTDAECSGYLSTCTTNGAGCVDRKRCQDAYLQIACVTNSLGNDCAWLDSEICVDKTCNTAPLSLNNEVGCDSYLPGQSCTTKKGGGCTKKIRCSDATVQQACTTAIDGTQCSWQNGACVQKSCSDLIGPTHDICQAIDVNCTTGGYYCAAITTCSATKIQKACINGTDGPCLWTNGACYNFTKCTDMIYTTFAECNQFSSYCTTNGNYCVPITTCALTPKVGCYVGTDGNCIWTPKTLLKSSSYQCKLRIACTDALYLTHQECYSYTRGLCTTDGINGCIELQSCGDYLNKSGCFIDKAGPTVVTSNNVKTITFNGQCKWSNSKCVQKTCPDLAGSSHTECNTQQSDCTFDGTKCSTLTSCSTFTTRNICSNVLGIEGQCIWESKICRPMGCADYPITLCSLYGVDCVQDGSVCVKRSSCTSFTTQSACEQGLTGSFCGWVITSNSSKGKCISIDSCGAASDNQKACTQLSNKCMWITKTQSGVTKSSCIESNCQDQTSGCEGFYSWDDTTYTICSQGSDGKCKAAEPTELAQLSCPTLSLKTYTWNLQLNACTQCITSSNGGNNTSNNGNTTTPGTNITTTTTWEQILLPLIVSFIMAF